MRTKFVILISHGEYDDHVEIPVAVAPDLVTAQIISEALENREQPYFNEILTGVFLPLRDLSEFCTTIVEVPLVVI